MTITKISVPKTVIVRLASDIAPKVAAAAASGAVATIIFAVLKIVFDIALPAPVESIITLLVTVAGGYLKAEVIPDLSAWLVHAAKSDPTDEAEGVKVATQIEDAAQQLAQTNDAQDAIAYAKATTAPEMKEAAADEAAVKPNSDQLAAVVETAVFDPDEGL